MMPTSILARIMGYQRKKVFEAAEAERQNIDVGQMLNR
jgi:hypothetical protein